MKKRLALAVIQLLLLGACFAHTPSAVYESFKTYEQSPNEANYVFFLSELDALEKSNLIQYANANHPDILERFYNLKSEAEKHNAENGAELMPVLIDYLEMQFTQQNSSSKKFAYMLWIVAIFIILYAFFFILYYKKDIEIKNSRILSEAILNAQEDERRTISYELHDTVAQNLRSISMEYENEEYSKSLLDKTISQIRSICYSLTPPELQSKELASAITILVDEMQKKSKIEYAVNLDGDDVNTILNSILPESQLHIFRIVQESLTNVEKHSNAKTCSVFANVDANKTLTIFITDNGDGFNPKQIKNKEGKHFGLIGMKERGNFAGAKVLIQSEEGSGTTVQVKVSP